jgi:hypothetical protein
MEFGQGNLGRETLIEGIDTIAGQVIPEKYNESEYQEGDHERVDIGVEVKDWLEEYLTEMDMQTGPVKTGETSGSVRRFVIEIEGGENSFIIAIHDPMGGHPKPAESITGADYIVEYPISSENDRFILVQTKRPNSSHGVPPKQFFAMGGVYMFGHYLTDQVKRWSDRFEEGIDYTNAFDNPHNEFMFIKYAGKDLYVPLSGVLNTHEFRTGETIFGHFKSGKTPTELVMIQHITKEQFADGKEAKEPFYNSFNQFYSALNDGEIGLKHGVDTNKARNKADSFARLADILGRPNITLFEATDDIFRDLSDYLRE